MRIDGLILATLLPFLVAGTCCFPPPKQKPFRLDTDITAAEYAVVGNYWISVQETPTCEMLCEEVYQHRRGWHPRMVDACEHTLTVDPDASPDAVVGHVKCEGTAIEYLCKGRRPLGHVEEEGGEGLAGYLARCAHLEAASVIAFVELAEALAEHGAPAGLIGRCLVAAEDERRHAAVIGELAGVRVAAVRQVPEDRSLRAIAVHNAVEGCVREAWAAVEAAWQARHAEPGLREAMVTIAGEEAAHAQLAWDVHAWLIGQVDDEARAEVLAGQRAAIAGLADVAAAEVPEALGMPEVAVRVAMARRFAAGLSAAA